MKTFKKIFPCLFKKNKEVINYITENKITWNEREIILLDKVNQYRKDNGLNELIMDDTCYKLAQMRNTLNINRGKISHDEFPATFKILIDLGCSWVGENLAYGYTNLDNLLSSWKKSDGHNKNILRNDWKYTGLAINGKYFCQIFAK